MQALGTIRGWTPILMLHEVLPDSTAALPPYAITRSTLRAILQDFTRRGYTFGTLDDVVGRPSAGARRLVLTFDDGTADFIEHALPVLQEFHFSATLFIVAGLIGGQRHWQGGPGGTPMSPVPLMGAADLRALAAQGFTIGSHTMSHADLPALPPAEAAAEITQSRAVLSDLLGQPVDWFAYPYVRATAATRALTQAAGYRGAVGGANQPHQRYYLNRLEVGIFSLPQLRWRTNGLYHFTRHTYRQLRYGR
jgi:peptidoglycan/xylan/chitin deacetylase (PgdA/CDA1 family)